MATSEPKIYPNLKINVSSNSRKRKVTWGINEEKTEENESLDDVHLTMIINNPPNKKRKYSIDEYDITENNTNQNKNQSENKNNNNNNSIGVITNKTIKPFQY
eukprot:217231_1